MGVTPAEFYDETRIAIVPMGFCFPGLDAKRGDKPPRRECAPRWRAQVFAHLPNLQVMLLVGQYAQKWHLGDDVRGCLTETVTAWREIAALPGRIHLIPLPHPSWRNNGWIKKYPWFEDELLPQLKTDVRSALR
jgi:uracil-DNA glycosylase